MNTRERAARNACRSLGINHPCASALPDCRASEDLCPGFRVTDAVLDEIRTPSSKLLREIAGAMSPGKRPTQARVSERAKHGIRWRAGIDSIKRGEG